MPWRIDLAKLLPIGAAMAVSVLIVDDDSETCEVLAEGLRDEGFDASCVKNGSAAIDALRSKPAPSVVLLDLLLPGEKDGWQVLREKAADPRLAPIPVIVMSAQPRLAPAIDGVMAILRKPFAWEDLLHFVEQATATARTA